MGRKERADGMAALRVAGAQVDYYSKDFACWVPASVASVDAETGSLEIDLRPGRAIELREQLQRLRPRTRPTDMHREWVRKVLREGRVEEEARKIFEIHSASDGGAALLRRGALGAVGEDLDRLLGVSGSVCGLKEEYGKRAGSAMTLEAFVGLFWEVLWSAHQDHVQALRREKGSEPRRPWATQGEYELGKMLGTGTYGQVYLAVHRKTRASRAIKIMTKDADGISEDEVRRLQQVDHPNIVKLYEYYVDEHTVAVVLDFCAGGDLQQALARLRAPPPEECTVHVMRQTMLAVNHIHRHGLMHLDLKCGNVMLMPSHATCPPARCANNGATPGGHELLAMRPHVMVIDLGMAEMFFPGRFRGKNPCGTPITMAPEIWIGEITPKADVFACGCILFELLTLARPWNVPSTEVSVMREFWARKPPVPWEKTEARSNEAVVLCQRMLLIDRYRRPSATQCLGFAFFCEGAGSGGGDTIRRRKPEELLRQLASAARRSQLCRKVALAVARAWPSNQLPSIERLFLELDKTGCGRLPVADVAAALEQRLGLVPSEAARTAAAADLDRSGHVDWTEFVSACIDLGSAELECELRRIFAEADDDGDGLLDALDVARLLSVGGKASEEAARDAMCDLVGRSSEGTRVDWPTFLAQFRPAAAAPRAAAAQQTLPAADAAATDAASAVELLPAIVRGYWQDVCAAVLPDDKLAKPDVASEQAVRSLVAMGFQDAERNRRALKRRGRNQVTGSVVDELMREGSAKSSAGTETTAGGSEISAEAAKRMPGSKVAFSDSRTKIASL